MEKFTFWLVDNLPYLLLGLMSMVVVLFSATFFSAELKQFICSNEVEPRAQYPPAMLYEPPRPVEPP